jgi:hypothetical protein
LFVANENRKLQSVFIGRQTINSNWRLLFQQTCPSMLTSNVYDISMYVDHKSVCHSCNPFSFVFNHRCTRSPAWLENTCC